MSTGGGPVDAVTAEADESALKLPTERPERLRGFRAIGNAARNGDPQAKAVLEGTFTPQLEAFLWAVDVPSPMDVTAHVWEQVGSQAKHYRSEHRFAVHLFTTACEVARQARNGAAPDQPRPKAVDERTASLRFIAMLPPAQAEVVALRLIAAFSLEDVATVTGRPRDEVRQLGTEGYATLQQMIG